MRLAYHRSLILEATVWALGGLALIALIGLLLGHALGCTRTDQQRALAVATEAAAGALPRLRAERDAEELACLAATPDYEPARACVEASRSRWAPVWAAYDLLVVIDSAAIDGQIDMASALGAYCTIAAVAGLGASALGACP